MADSDDDRDVIPTQPSDPGTRWRRAGNGVEDASPLARSPRRTADAEAPAIGEPGGPSHRPGDVPASFTRRYLTEAVRGTGVAFYEGPGAKRPAFQDFGQSLSTDQTHPAIVRDLAAIALHRGWSVIRVRGSDEFRREVWREARTRGIEVKGYKPTTRDQQELDQRQERAAAAASRDRAAIVDRKSDKAPGARRYERPGVEAGVGGILVASGEAPYRRKAGAPTTPFIRIDRGDGRRLDIWGADLPQALDRSGARLGDHVRVRRDGLDIVQRSMDDREPIARPGGRGSSSERWTSSADRFRNLTPQKAARDPDLSGAQSHLAVLNTVINRVVHDPKLRAILRAEAHSVVADELARGLLFQPARVREIEPVLARDIADARAQERSGERAHRH